jgi:hypothetical protein
MVAPICIQAMQEIEIGGFLSEASSKQKHESLSEKKPKQKKKCSNHRALA